MFSSIKRTLEHQHEIEKLKGENFNVFSVLGLERYENKTHSSFIAELLNPKGSHLKGNVFLKLFLETIGMPKHLDLTSARCGTEISIGLIDSDNKTGGRVDIFLKDQNGKTICIENKIDAGDQDSQIERYVNYNTQNNVVLYLSRNGTDASEQSRGKYVDGQDYFTISYRHDVKNWLRNCLREAYDQPILRETIKQYLILIQKITNQLGDSQMEKELLDTIESDYQSAKVVESLITQVEIRKVTQLLNELKEKLEEELTASNWEIEISERIGESYEGFRVRYKEWPHQVYIKLESQSRMPFHNTVLGITATKDLYDREEVKKLLEELNLPEKGYPKETKGWPFFNYIINWSSEKKRAELFDQEKFKELKEQLFEDVVSLAKGTEQPLSKLKPKNS